MKTIDDAIHNSQLRVRKYEYKKIFKHKKPIRSRFKLVAYFVNGGEAHFHSYDHFYSYELKDHIIDEFIGLTQLLRLYNRITSQNHIRSLCIYMNIASDPISENKHYNFPVLVWLKTKGEILREHLEFDNGKVNFQEILLQS